LFSDRLQARRFDRLVKPHLRGLFRFAYRLTGNNADAEDLVQDVMVKLYPRTAEVAEVEDLRPWLNRVLYRQFLDARRHRSRRPEGAMLELVDDADMGSYLDQLTADTLEPLAEMEYSQLQQLLRETLDTLPEKQRTLLVMHDMEGWRQDDLAVLMEVSPGTVRSRLHRYRQALRTQLIKKLEQ